MSALGRHILVEFFDCSSEILNDVSYIEKIMLKAAEISDAIVINSTFHHFSPFGVSGVVVIQESHLAAHTWPEYKYAAVDIFTCGDTIDPWVSYNYLLKTFKASHGSTMELHRGQLDLLDKINFNIDTLRDEASKKIQKPKTSRNIWFTERDDNIALSLRHTGSRLFHKKSKYQKVEIYDTYQYGKMLTCDGIIMCTEKDEYVYHEMITHVAMFTHPDVKNILIIGGGDGGTVRELLRHENVEKIDMIEIDKVVIEAAQKYLTKSSFAFNHDKVTVKIEDGIKYVLSAPDETYDLIIIDSGDPVGPAEGLFTENFYQCIYKILKPQGILIAQSESPRFNVHFFREIYQRYKKVFKKENVHCYLAYIPTYPSGMWSFSYNVKGSIHPLKNLRSDEARIFTEKHDLKYYSDEIHKSAFVLPKFVKDLIE